MKDDLVGHDKLNLFRLLALGVLVAGALGSLDLTLKAGHNNKSFILVALFVIWVLSPFIIFLIANIASRRWSFLARVMLYILTIFITVGSLVGYSGALTPPGAKPAGVFLIVPLLSWVLIVITYLIVSFRKTK